MKEKFCIKCGKKGIIGDYCQDCKPEDEVFTKDIKISLCCICNKVLYHNKWHSSSPQEIIEKALKKSHKNAKVIEFKTPEFKPGVNKEVEALVRIDNEDFILPINVSMTYCPQCGKRGSQYFEGKLQLRKPTEEVNHWLSEEFEKAEKRGRFVNKQESKKDITTFYLTDSHYLQTLGKKLYERFGGILKTDSTLFSRDRQTCKDIYRVTVTFEPSQYKSGDVVMINDNNPKPVHIKSVSSKLTGTNMLDNSRYSSSYKNLPQHEPLKKSQTMILTTQPTVTIMHPQTYQEVIPENHETFSNLKINDKVNVVEVEGKFWIVEKV